MTRVGIHARQNIQLNSIGLYHTLFQGADDFVIATGERQFELGQAFLRLFFTARPQRQSVSEDNRSLPHL